MLVRREAGTVLDAAAVIQDVTERWNREKGLRHAQPETANARGGRNAKTLINHPDVKVVLTTLRADSRIPGHQASGRVSIQVVRGHVRMHVGQAETVDLLGGHLLTLDPNVPHELQALIDSALLLTVTSPERTVGQPTSPSAA